MNGWLWLVTGLAALAALVAQYFWWQRRLARLREEESGARQELETEKQQLVAQANSQRDALFNSMAEGVLLLDANGRIQFGNRALEAMFGLTGDLSRRTVIEALRLHELAELVDSLLVGKGGGFVARELKLARPRERWVQVHGASLSNETGNLSGLVLVFHDLTRLKKFEETRRDFVANVSHELRTPLSLIKGYVETLLDGAMSDPDLARKFLTTISRNADRLQLLIEDLLVLSELESGRVQLQLQPTSLDATLRKLFEDYRARALAKPANLVNQTASLTVCADPRRLEQVLGNLVDNALKYGTAGGDVTVGARSLPGDMVEISVRNDGPGIPAEALERIFERFYRVDKARSREQGGTGLGLAIVKHIVQNHGGRVWATSDPGQGATFHFTLPAKMPQLQPEG